MDNSLLTTDMASRIVGAVFFTLFTLFGILANSLLIVIFYKGRDFFSSIPFYIISYQIIICDFLIYIPQLTVVLPSALLSDANVQDYKRNSIFNILASLDSFGFYATLHFTFLMVFNRFGVICFQKLNILFQVPKIYAIVLFIWLFTVALFIMEEYYCPKTFNTHGLYLHLDCSRSGSAGLKYIGFRYYWTIVIPVAMFLIYCAIFIHIRRRRQLLSGVELYIEARTSNENELREQLTHTKRCVSEISGESLLKRRRNCETTLLIQATIICGVLEVETVCFYVFPALSNSLPQLGIVLNVVQNCLVIFNNFIHPIVYFAFNHEVRRIVKATLCE